MSRRIYKGLSILGNGDEVFPPGTLSVDYYNNTINVHNGTTPGGEPLTVSGGGGGNLGDLEVTGTTIGIAGGASENDITVGGAAAALFVQPSSDTPIAKLHVTSYDSNTFTSSSSDFSSGSYTANGAGGLITLSGAAVVIDYLNNQAGNITSLVINGTYTVPYDGGGAGLGDTVILNTSTAPAVDPTDVTQIEFMTEFEHRIVFDVDDSDFGIYIGDENFDIESLRDINIQAGDDLRLESSDIFDLTNNGADSNDGIRIITDNQNSQRIWFFSSTGDLTFPNDTVQSTAYPGIPGPYADDVAASSAGVAVGNPYYRSSGQVFVRLS